ncbi:MAG: hypothetical protein J6B81_04920 [Spirochaetaceae bacterium]|nr:hypothetical protein [Spirochaetaceae bacterium]
MECNKVLLDSVNSFLKINTGKAVIGLLLVLLLSSTLTPIALLASLISSSLLFPLIVLLLCTTVVVMLMFGYMSLLALLYRGQPAILGHIFDCFRDWKRGIKLSLLFSTMLIIISFVAVIVAFTVTFSEQKTSQLLFEEAITKIMNVMPFMTIICIVVFALFVVWPNAFVWLVFTDNPAFTIKQTFRKAHSLQKGKMWRLLFFLFRIGGIWLCVACLSSFVSSIVSIKFMDVIASGNQGLHYSFIIKICDTVSFVGFYYVLIKMMVGVIAFYDALIRDERENSIFDKNVQSIEVPVIELPAPDMES